VQENRGPQRQEGQGGPRSPAQVHDRLRLDGICGNPQTHQESAGQGSQAAHQACSERPRVSLPQEDSHRRQETQEINQR